MIWDQPDPGPTQSGRRVVEDPNLARGQAGAGWNDQAREVNVNIFRHNMQTVKILLCSYFFLLRMLVGCSIEFQKN